MLNICGYYPESINEGPGIRAVLFISGCKHYCRGCFNAKAWSFDLGEPFDDVYQEKVMTDVSNNPLIEGLTLCGGDPFFSAKELVPFVKRFSQRFPEQTIWAYSGFTYEAILADSELLSLLEFCDVLIDGKFIEEQKDLTLAFRGSRNQRIIDVKQSLYKKSVVLTTY